MLCAQFKTRKNCHFLEAFLMLVNVVKVWPIASLEKNGSTRLFEVIGAHQSWWYISLIYITRTESTHIHKIVHIVMSQRMRLFFYFDDSRHLILPCDRVGIESSRRKEEEEGIRRGLPSTSAAPTYTLAYALFKLTREIEGSRSDVFCSLSVGIFFFFSLDSRSWEKWALFPYRYWFFCIARP